MIGSGSVRGAAIALTMTVPVAAAETPAERAVAALVKEATTLANAGRFPESLALADQAVALADRTLPRRNVLRFEAMRRRAVTMTYVDDGAAPGAFDRVGQVAEQVYGRGSFEAAFSRFKGVQWSVGARRPGSSLAQLAVALDAVAAVAKGDEQVTLTAQAMAVLANQMSFVDLAGARPIAARAFALAESVPAVTAADRGQAYSYLASVAARDSRPANALTLSGKAARLFEIDQGRSSHHLVNALGTQANAARRLGEYGLAETLLRRAVAIVDSRPQLPADHRARALMDYSRFLAERGQRQLALPLADRAAVEAAKLPPGTALPQLVTTSAGELHLAAGRPEDAVRYLRRALAMTETAEAPTIIRAQVLAQIGRAELAQGDFAAAQASAEQAIAVVDAVSPAGHSLRGDARRILADLADARGDHAAAAQLYARAAAELTAGNADPAAVSGARIRGAAMLARLGRLDAAAWRDTRAASDALILDIGRQASAPLGDTALLTLPPALLDGAIDVAWARAQSSDRR